MSLPASSRKKHTQSCISVLALFSLQTENTSRSEKVRLYRHCSWWPHRGSLPRLHILLRQWFKPFLTAAAPLGLEGGCSGSTSLVAPPSLPRGRQRGLSLLCCWSQGGETQLLLFQGATQAPDFTPGCAANHRPYREYQWRWLMIVPDRLSPLLAITLKQSYAECQ